MNETNKGRLEALQVGVNSLTSEYILMSVNEWNEYIRKKETSPNDAAIHLAKHKLLKKVIRDLEGVVRNG